MTRTTTLLLVACGLFFWSRGHTLPLGWLGDAPLEPEEKAAVELQCRSMDGALRATCEVETTESLVAGEFDPEPILRVHCTRFESVWAPEAVEIPPDLCITRYGGWLSS